MESFHANLRAEFPDRELFYKMKEVSVMLENWRDHYNHERQHGSLANRPPGPKYTIGNPAETKKIIPQSSH